MPVTFDGCVGAPSAHVGAAAPTLGNPVVKVCDVLQGVGVCCLTQELRRMSTVRPMARRARRIDANQARNSACGWAPVPMLVRSSTEETMAPDKPNTERIYMLTSVMRAGVIPTV